MAKVLEKAIEGYVRDVAKKMGVPSTKLQGLGNKAEPDRVFWIPGGRPFLIEFKVPGKVPTPLQALKIAEFIKLGYDVEVHDDKRIALAAIRTRLDAAHLPEAGSEVPDRKGVCRPLPRPRTRKD